MIKILTPLISLILILFALSLWMKINTAEKEKKSIFECGFDPAHEKRNSFSLRFFMMTIIFLLFDLEITFILPLPLQMKNSPATVNMIIHFIIIYLFVMSTYLEWNQGALSWMWLGI